MFTLDSPGTTDACPASNKCTAQYFYDDRDQLIKYLDGRGKSTTYDLDPAGNLLREVEGSTTRTHTYTGQRLESVTSQVGTQTRSTVYQHYDPHGNLDCTTLEEDAPTGCSPSNDAASTAVASSLVSDYTYDSLNRLIAYRQYSGSVLKKKTNYRYDALDRLVKQVDTQGSQTKSTAFSHLGVTNLVTQEDVRFGAAPVRATNGEEAKGLGRLPNGGW